MSEQHTPGPWRASVRQGAEYIGIVGPRGESVGSAYRDNREANARLMAAAPDLLAALERIVLAWKSVPEDVQVPDEINVNEMWEQAEEAIARAKGA